MRQENQVGNKEEGMNALKPGDKAPDFEILSDQDQLTKLTNFRGRKVVLYFYPKDDTSGCTTQACTLRDNYPEIEEKNAVVLGVSPDGVASHQKFRSKYDLPFNLLVDPAHELADLYGAWGEKSMYGKKYMGIIRSQFVIDENGIILDARYKISPKKSAEEALRNL
jgi:peroxiredoxin Q/BCP